MFAVEAEEVGTEGLIDSDEEGRESITREIVAGTIPITAAINGTKVDIVKTDRRRRRILVFSIVLGEDNLTMREPMTGRGFVFAVAPPAGRGFVVAVAPWPGSRRQAAFILYVSRYLARLFICGHFK